MAIISHKNAGFTRRQRRDLRIIQAAPPGFVSGLEVNRRPAPPDGPHHILIEVGVSLKLNSHC